MSNAVRVPATMYWLDRYDLAPVSWNSREARDVRVIDMRCRTVRVFMEVSSWVRRIAAGRDTLSTASATGSVVANEPMVPAYLDRASAQA